MCALWPLRLKTTKIMKRLWTSSVDFRLRRYASFVSVPSIRLCGVCSISRTILAAFHGQGGRGRSTLVALWCSASRLGFTVGTVLLCVESLKKHSTVEHDFIFHISCAGCVRCM